MTRRLSILITIPAFIALTASCTAAPVGVATRTPGGGGSASPTAPSSSATEACPTFERDPHLGVAFLTEPLAWPINGLSVQLIVAEDTGEADLSNSPVLVSTQIAGTSPIHDPTLRVGIFEAGSTGCAARLLIDESVFSGPSKASPLWFELDLPSLHLTLTDSTDGTNGRCSWLVDDSVNAAAIECLGIPPERGASGPVRVWLRMAWNQLTTATDDSPAWATAALAPSPPPTAPGSGDRVLMKAGPADAFKPVDGPFPNASMLQATTVAVGPAGWVAAGAYDPAALGDELSQADAPIWWSPDGRTWERVGVGDPELGGPGLQTIRRVVATPDGWIAVGETSVGTTPDTLVSKREMWRSQDGRSWRRFEPTCALIDCPVADARFAPPDVATLQDGRVILLGKGSSGRISSWGLDGDTLIDGGPLPIDPGVASGRDPEATRFAASSDLVCAFGAYSGPTDQRIVGWCSGDGVTWNPLPASISDTRASLGGVLDFYALAESRVAVGGNGLAVDNGFGWRLVNETNNMRDLVATSGGMVAVGGTDLVGYPGPPQAVALWSGNGLDWTPMTIDAGPREQARSFLGAASDGSTLVVVGTSGDNAGIWVSE